MKNLQSLRLCAAAVVLAVFAVSALLSPVAGQEDEARVSEKFYVRTGQEGTVHGTIFFSGKAQRRQRINMSQDGECQRRFAGALDESLVVTKGKITNVFVYMKEGNALKDYVFETPMSPVVLDQKGCRFVPHVLGVQVRQTLKILNSDLTIHNVNGSQVKLNERWNMSQDVGEPPIVKAFARPELFIPIKCNLHPWMKAYVNVMKHPFFAVTGRDGSYRIEGLPPGEYTLMAWHEKLGEKSVRVIVAPSQTHTQNFTFKGPETN
ncbi:MAG TPA: carboxypeptidase regulatory-like domain-containing protein [Pyrinomonadaceae bacterium]|jgi:hypothetical protein